MNSMVSRTDRAVRRGALVALLAVVSLSACTAAEVTNPGGQADVDDVKAGVLMQVTADAKSVGQGYVTHEMETGTFSGFDPKSVRLSASDRVLDVKSDPTGQVNVCVLDPTTGAWALWQSVSKSITGSGESQTATACTPGG